MSLELVLRTAVGGLMAQQAALRNTANNVANVNTPGYARTEVALQTSAIGGLGAGVEIGEVRRVADSFLEKELTRAIAYADYFRAQADLHDRLQLSLGKPDSAGSLAGRIDAMFAAFGKATVDATDLPRRVDAVQQTKALADEVGRLAAEVQSLRGEADQRIAGQIATVNGALTQIARLNTEIARIGAVGGDATGLAEQRAQAMSKIAGILDVRAIEQADGQSFLYTSAGAVLLDSQPRQLVYRPAGTVGAESAFGAITINRVGADGQPQGNGEPLYPSLRSGSLKGLIDMRDVELPQVAAMLGTLAEGLAGGLNAAHSESSTVPPPATLAGRNVGALATDPHGFAGRTTFVSFDANGAIDAQVTIDFSSHVTLGDVVGAVNAGLGGQANLTLSGGALQLATAGAGGVAIVPDAGTPASRAGQGFAQFFGMNDLLRGGVATGMADGLDASAGHGFGSSGTVAIELRGPGGQVAASHVLDFSALGGTVAAVLADLNAGLAGRATAGFDPNGRLTVTPAAGFETYAVHVASDSTLRGGTGVSFSGFFGLGQRYPAGVASGLAVRSDILADTDLLALARVDLTGDPPLSASDNRGGLALEAAQQASVGFRAAGDLGAVSQTVGGYAAALLASVGSEAARVDGLSQDRAVLVDEIRSRRDAVSGVNLDEELSNMVLFQNAYNAAARLITTANRMYETLLQIV